MAVKRKAAPKRKTTRRKTTTWVLTKCAACNGSGRVRSERGLTLSECKRIAESIGACSSDTTLFLRDVKKNGFAKAYERALSGDIYRLLPNSFLCALSPMWNVLYMNNETVNPSTAYMNPSRMLKEFPADKFIQLARKYIDYVSA